MIKPQYTGPDYPQSEIPLKMVDSPDALFDFAPDSEPAEELAAPIRHALPPSTPIEPRRSEAWDAIGNHNAPFMLPDDEDQVFAVDRHSPNPKTSQEIERIKTNRRFGLTGRSNRTPEQDAMARQAAQAGHDGKEQRRIAGGMSRASARVLRMIEAINRGEDTTYLELPRNDSETESISAVAISEAKDISTPYVLPNNVVEALQATADSSEQRKILRRDRQRFIKEKKGFYGLTNKEINKIIEFDRLTYKSKTVRGHIDMVKQARANRKSEYPVQEIRTMVDHYGQYGVDAYARIDQVEQIIEAIDEKSDHSKTFKDAFPADDWMRGYPEERAKFISLGDYVATKKFVIYNGEDNVTKRAMSRKVPSEEVEIQWIIDTLGGMNLTDVKLIAQEYMADQADRLQYWKYVISEARNHVLVRDIGDRALTQLSWLGIAPPQST
jgi:hypothetical protein